MGMGFCTCPNLFLKRQVHLNVKFLRRLFFLLCLLTAGSRYSVINREKISELGEYHEKSPKVPKYLSQM